MAAALPCPAESQLSRRFISHSLVLQLSRSRNAEVLRLSLQPQSISWGNLRCSSIPRGREPPITCLNSRGQMHNTGAVFGTAQATAETATSTPKSVRTRITYIQPPKKGERLLITPGAEETTTLRDNVADVDVLDTRHLAEAPTIDRNGFQVVPIEPLLKDYNDDNEVKEVLYPAVVEAVKRVTGASQVEIFMGHMRRRRRDLPRDQLTEKFDGGDNQPVAYPHTDYSLKSGIERLILAKGEEASQSLLKNRFAIIQFWMPTKGPVYDAPLALLDPSSIGPEDRHFVDIVFGPRVQEIYHFSPSTAHKWYYTSRMKPTEAYLFKSYDSREDVARYTPHVAFLLPDFPADAPRRESIDMRMFAFWDK
eukprot:TRINITY_DN4316_c0_g4_i1.p1 TRINITY_DN4316_c0_g4~~TRINITY_DN4316_c0_g4_i1.p1  ORF type:complete len:375 (+),score=37.21 TRINITY_DN4316_c0_g4_i1:29-1126(+)